MVVRLHHVEVLCQSLEHGLKQFCGKFGFRVLAHSSSPDRIALNRGCINFVLSEGARERETVFNVALEVNDVNRAVDNVERNSGKIIRGPETLVDTKGYVESAVVQTPVGNVVHTLLNTSSYEGIFFPGFIGCDKVAFAGASSYVTPMNSEKRGTVISDRILTHFDHITFACPLGTSQSIMKWYEKCFGFTRFKMSNEESQDGFFVQSRIQGERIGVKLTAMQYWLCAESELAINTDEPGGGVKFVFAEPLPGQGPNQVETFLREHEGPGIQHIGLHSPNITNTVAALKENGVTFIDPPAAYYSQEEKLLEIEKVGECVRSLQTHGILLDAESFNESSAYQDVAETCKDTKYLMQVFTQPLFDRETFFLEVIQRCGATGFGAGNITALWKAVDSYLRDCSDKTNS